jgi:hypothetical protein
MADSFMRKILFQETIAGVLIGRDEVDGLADSLADESIKCNGIRILDYLADYVALAADGPDDANLAGTDTARHVALLVPMAVLVLSADEHLIHFHDAHKLAEIGIVHGGAEPHAHVPSGLVRAASNLALNLKSANALLGIEHLPENLEPSLKWIFSVLENCPAGDTKAVVLAWLAEPMKRPCVEFIDGGIPAFWTADNAILPTPFHQELLARFVRRERRHPLSERHHAS